MSGPFRYIGVIMVPIFMPIVWLIFALAILVAGNIFLGGGVPYRKLFALVSWSNLVSLIGIPLGLFLIFSKGTTIGVELSLAALLPPPGLAESKSVFYLMLSKFDIFTIWQLFLWTVGLSVFYKTTFQKAVVPVAVLWIIWIVISVGFSSLFGGMFGM